MRSAPPCWRRRRDNRGNGDRRDGDRGDDCRSGDSVQLIVATYGGMGLATQRECLELLGCFGPGKVLKLAEIAAATVLCGEVSLGWAILAGERVTAHELLGRNRPG